MVLYDILLRANQDTLIPFSVQSTGVEKGVALGQRHAD